MFGGVTGPYQSTSINLLLCVRVKASLGKINMKMGGKMKKKVTYSERESSMVNVVSVS